MTRTEALTWIQQAPDASGECDGCHKENVSLWVLPMEFDSEPPEANWAYCKDCYRRHINRMAK